MRGRRLLWAGLLLMLPTLVLGGLALQKESDRYDGQYWRLKITGYDPRDLLYGHYLRFRFDWDAMPQEGRCETEASCCLRLTPRSDAPWPRITQQDCSLAVAGDESLVPKSVFVRKTATEKYFIPETAEHSLNALLRDPKNEVGLEVRITPSGQRIFGELFVNGLPWRDYIQQHPEAVKP